MGLINKFLDKLFGNRPTQAAAPSTQSPAQQQPVEDFYSKWQRKRMERAAELEVQLKDWLIATIKRKGSIAFSWESGNDEAFVDYELSKEEEPEAVGSLETYIVFKLDIPDAGEFNMTGSGSFYIDGGHVRIKYNSVMKDIVDYDEENGREIYNNEVVDSGEMVLFPA